MINKFRGEGMSSLLLADNAGERLAEALSPEKIPLFGTKLLVNPSFYTAFAVAILLIVAAVILRLTVIRKMKNVPGKIQGILEMLVKSFSGMANGKYNGYVGCYIMVAGIYICVGTLVELLGFRPIMADLNACVALGLSTFGIIFFFGFREHGIKRFKRYLNPINVVTDLAVPVSMSFRLFGSIVSGLLITELIYSYLFTSFVVPVFISVITTLFHALIQAFIFATLSSLFIGEATE